MGLIPVIRVRFRPRLFRRSDQIGNAIGRLTIPLEQPARAPTAIHVLDHPAIQQRVHLRTRATDHIDDAWIFDGKTAKLVDVVSRHDKPCVLPERQMIREDSRKREHEPALDVRTQVTERNATYAERLVNHRKKLADIGTPHVGTDDAEGLVHRGDKLFNASRHSRAKMAMHHASDLHCEKCTEQFATSHTLAPADLTPKHELLVVLGHCAERLDHQRVDLVAENDVRRDSRPFLIQCFEPGAFPVFGRTEVQ